VECVATLQCIASGELDLIHIQPRPLDVLAQQIVAAAASEDWEDQKLFELARAAYPYRELSRKDFDEVVTMLAEGFSTKRGRRGALIHHDAINHRIRGRRAARLVALTSGGAIPDNGDYRVVMEPGDTFIGTVNEDFAVESMAGDIFQLGNTSWKITQVVAGTVRVADAQGQPPGMPFWLGEGPARTAELSRAVSNLRDKVQEIIETSNNSPQSLIQNYPVALGSAVVPTAVFGVPPKTLSISDSAPFHGGEKVMELAGGTPAKATGTVALPTALFRLTGGTSTIARTVSLFVALGFAAHPVNSETVCWAKCMDDLMAGVFVLAAMRSLLKWNTGWRDYVLALVWFLAAGFSKESSVPFALIVVFILAGFHKLSRKRSIALSVPFFCVGLIFAICQRLVMGRTTQCPPLSGTYAQTLIDMLPVGADYARLLLGIPPFCADYNFMVGAPPHAIFSGAVLGGLYLLVFFPMVSIWLWRREPWRLSSFGLIWIAAFLMPVSNLVPMMQYMAERFLYLPLIGFLLALGGVLLNFPRQRLFLTTSATMLIILWTATSANRMGIWRDELTLFIGTELEHPGIKRIEKNAVGAVLRLPQIQAGRAAKTLSPVEAEPILATLQKARQIYPENDLLTTQLGIFELKLGRTTEAIALLELAARQNPDAPERWYNLATTYHLLGENAKSREACAHALRLNPQYPETLHLQSELDNSSKTSRTILPSPGK
jgi:hypothetical protein